MNTGAARHKRSWERLLGLENREAPEFIRRPEELTAVKDIRGSAHLLRRTWGDLQLDGMFFANGQPTLYVKTMEDDAEEARRLHQTFWNQGMCPTMALVTPSEVKVYSGLALPTSDTDKLDDDGRLVKAFRHADTTLRYLVMGIEEGSFLARYPKNFDPTRRVDRCLLKNLKATRARMIDKGNLDGSIVDALLTRAIFCCYLVDRGVIGKDYFAAVGQPHAANLRDFLCGGRSQAIVDRLYALFGKFRTDFNGDLFGMDLDKERAQVSSKHIEFIQRLLAGDDMEGGQMALDFWAYDFRAIPIETISAIYQEFLSLDGPQRQRETGAYYTPRMLADTTLDMALEGVPSLCDLSFLDPSCGSGVFLVGLLNRMAEELRCQEPDIKPHAFANKLKAMLTNQLYGVDLNSTACRIAAFSLYLALLDQLESRDIRTLQKKGKFLPKLAVDARGTAGTIFCSDFFSDNLHLPSCGFDIIVGNPPWGEMNAQTTRWCREHRLDIPQKQASPAFMWKAGQHLKPQGKACFVLPLKLLTYTQGPAVAFQREWLRQFAVDKILNLADTRLYLFEGAIHPAMIARYAAPDTKPHNGLLEYSIARSETETLHTDIITVSPDDRITLKVSRLIHELESVRVPGIWKQAMWGSPRDRTFLDRLADFPTLGDRLKGDLGQRGWDAGEGFNRGGDGRPVERDVLRRLQFLPARHISPFVVGKEALGAAAPTTCVRRGGCEPAYFAPHMVFTRGVPLRAHRISAAFSAVDFTFEHALRGVHAPQRDEDLLRFLTCVVCSPLAMHVYFHTSANWGVERAQLHQAEFEQLPFPAAEFADRQQYVAEAAQLHRKMEHECAANFIACDNVVAEYGPRLDRLVLAFYGVNDWEEALINDTVHLWIPSATPRRNARPPALETSTPDERRKYRGQLLECLNTWAMGNDTRVSARIVRSDSVGLGIVHLSRKQESRAAAEVPESESPDELDRILKRVQGVLDHRGLNLRYRRNLKVFAGDDLYILKPLSRRYWCRTAALNDADEIAATILSRHGRKC